MWLNISRSNSYTPVTLIPISVCKDRYYVKLHIYTACWLLSPGVPSPRVQAAGCKGVSTQINYRAYLRNELGQRVCARVSAATHKADPLTTREKQSFCFVCVYLSGTHMA